MVAIYYVAIKSEEAVGLDEICRECVEWIFISCFVEGAASRCIDAVGGLVVLLNGTILGV